MTGGGGGRLSKLGTALVIIFAITVVALFAQFFYALWRRLVFRRHANSVGGGADEVAHNTPSESTTTLSPIASSKELLYFFCIRPQLRLDRSAVTADSGATDLNSNRQSDVEVIDVELLKIEGMFGPPRFLFTIKEEEREDLELPPKTTLYPAAEKEGRRHIDDDENGGSLRLDEYAEDSVVVVVDIHDCRLDDATPFSTPCASPVYFTPSASPVHDMVNHRSPVHAPP